MKRIFSPILIEDLIEDRRVIKEKERLDILISKRQLQQLGIEKYRGSTDFIGLTVTSFKGDVFVPCSHEADAQVSRVPPAPQDPQE